MTTPVVVPFGYFCNTQGGGNTFNDTEIDSGGNLILVKGIDFMSQTIKNSLWLWIAEYVFNILIGVPYLLILGNPNIEESLIQFYLSRQILTVNNYLTTDQLTIYGIKEITSLIFDFDTNQRVENVQITILFNNNQTTQIIA
jgi:hypothetical protein